MARFVARRLLLAIPILLGVSIVVFITIKLIPGDPVSTLLGPNATPQARADLTSRLGLDQPLPVQYFSWLKSVVQGDFGTSLTLQQPVGSLVSKAFLNTALLAGTALILALIGGVVLGTIVALRPRGALAKVVSATSVAAISIPQYTVALLALLFAVETGALPTGGMHDTGAGGAGDLLEHLILPAVAAALTPMGIVARMYAVSLSDVLSQEFIGSLRARGLSQRTVVRHAMHNAVPSLLTITGLQVGYLLGGVLFVETIFSWPGLGLLVYQTISSRDMAVIQAGVLVSAVVLVLVNVLVDTVHGFIDPRVRA
jgi:peptide/nickel transport system permease protein